MMNELLSLLLAALESLASETGPVLVGFILGWLLFEVTEWRRARLARRELRSALVAELENAEILTSIAVIKYARLCERKEDVSFVAGEIRWFQDVGRHRMQDLGVLSVLRPIPSELKSLSDDQLITVFSSIKETIGTKIIMPVLERALTGQILGFRANQIQVLSMVRVQAHLLEQDVEMMHELHRLSFTVTDENNHRIVVENHDQRVASYALRAQILLRAIRAALQGLRHDRR